MRHTFASLLLSQGEPLNYVKEQLGHASIQTTVDVYGHIVPGSNRNAVNKLDDEGLGGLSEVLRLLKFEVCSDLATRQLELKTELKCSFIGMGVVVQFDGTQV
jgi:hypothetical protein